MLNIYDKKSLEKYSSAVTLSDMEIFIFPELMLSLVLANIMSPVIWKWKDDPWFEENASLSDYRKVLRLKQYIMDSYDFNLDLDTWGLTTKNKELKRFDSFIDEDTLAQSNALFGYEGDKYYFDMDIRKHFGLDKYTDITIPYWKTETIEAMTNFYRREGYSKGAGECVSLSTLYYASLFIMAGIPLERVYMIATPLHSQNFVDINHGLLTNNRRLVTQNMWFNGTELSSKAKRALVHERITFVGNNTGYIHRIYEEATIPKEIYLHFKKILADFLKTDVTYEIITNFLRENNYRQKCFQFVHKRFGKDLYIPAERVFQYEHSSNFRAGSNTQEKLLNLIDEDEYYTHPLEGRLSLSRVEESLTSSKVTVEELERDPEKILLLLKDYCPDAKKIIDELISFCRTVPMLPDEESKLFIENKDPITIDKDMDRNSIIEYLSSMKGKSETVDLAFLAYRQIEGDNWYPFMKAALERNPVSLKDTENLSDEEVYKYLQAMNNESIYSENRLSQPDEVWNFKTGDGLEKAILLWNIFNNRYKKSGRLQKNDTEVTLLFDGKSYKFSSGKDVKIPPDLSEKLEELAIG